MLFKLLPERLRHHPQWGPRPYRNAEIIESVYAYQKRKLWPDTKARLLAKLDKQGSFDYSPAFVLEVELAIQQEQAWDWD